MMFPQLTLSQSVSRSPIAHLDQAIWSPDYDHPIFARYRLQPTRRGAIWRSGLWVTFMLMLMAAITLLLLNPSNTLFVIMLMILGAPLLAVAFNGWVLGMAFTVAIVRSLSAYGVVMASDLMRLTHIGSLDACVMVATATLHRQNRLHRLHRSLRSVVGVALVTCLVAGLLIIGNILSAASDPQTLEVAYRSLAAIIPIACLFIVMYLDFHYATSSAVLAVLVSVQLKGFQQAVSAHISAIAAFFLIYCLPYVIGLVTLLCLRIVLMPYWALAIVPIGVVILLVMELYLLRQMLITVIWNRLNTSY
ncbi:MAG: hypothetical protein CL607_24770 [Anaerolineaceae bacterium]|nr:hypothetical protein [Anaerolineaceae bacterium]